MGVPKIKGTIIRIIAFWGLHWGSPYLANLPHEFQVLMKPDLAVGVLGWNNMGTQMFPACHLATQQLPCQEPVDTCALVFRVEGFFEGG